MDCGERTNKKQTAGVTEFSLTRVLYFIIGDDITCEAILSLAMRNYILAKLEIQFSKLV